MGYLVFSVRSSIIWTKLPQDIRLASSLLTILFAVCLLSREALCNYYHYLAGSVDFIGYEYKNSTPDFYIQAELFEVSHCFLYYNSFIFLY